MKNLKKVILIIPVLMLVMTPVSRALTFNDPINTAINTLRNTIMQAQWVKDFALAFDRLNELKSQTLEMFRFHSGLDEILDSVIGDPFGDLLGQGKSGLRDAFIDAGFITPQIEILEGGRGPADIRKALEEISGEIPVGNLRPYIPFEEMMVVDAFDLAREIREAGTDTRDSAERIADQAQSASPKGAARLQAQGISQLMVLGQQNQEAVAKLLELNATQIEQVNRLEKAAESERIQYLKDANQFMEDHFASFN